MEVIELTFTIFIILAINMLIIRVWMIIANFIGNLIGFSRFIEWLIKKLHMRKGVEKMKTNRAIVMFPKFRNIEVIDEIRSKYDPLFSFIAPHITLVFPFQSDLSKELLIEHLENQLREVKAFDLILKGVTGAADGYVFLDVKTGNDNIIALHDKLYSGILKDYHNRFIPYTPHITIANIKDEKAYNDLIEELKDFDEEFSTMIDSISIEIIDGPDKSIVEYEYKLQVTNKSSDNDD